MNLTNLHTTQRTLIFSFGLLALALICTPAARADDAKSIGAIVENVWRMLIPGDDDEKAKNTLPGHEKTPPGLTRTPPGHTKTPPGHTRIPPGQAKKLD
ncbi:hypothetical protein [Magnetofaba australis]|uniref:hypothetical protein n=1 Tax=Magnetofaba australis TaxID=1472297 RepID=UPI000A19F55B|nr:hypothetical protein [Magnetofaba australis]